MKAKGIKRGNTIELVDQTLDIPDGTEVMVIITLLTDLIGSVPGSFATPEEADQFIREQQDEWDY